ncbi:MAG: DUF2442 domain-containing protein [Verrucomicrobiota bacterium]
MSILHVIDLKYLGEHRLALRFDDSTEGEVDLSNDLSGEVFAPLRDPNFFAHAKIEGGAVTWPNGADLAPEYLREKIANKTVDATA